MAAGDEDRRGIQSIVVGGRLLKALVDSGRPMALREIAASADITPAQAHAYLVSHKRVGMVVQEFESGPYLLGPLALRLGLSRLNSLPIYRRTGAVLRDLSATLNVMSILVVWGPRGPAAVMVVQARDKRSDLNVRMGTQFPVVNTAVGRVFGAFHTPKAVEERVAREFGGPRAPHSGTRAVSPEEFRAMVERIRRDRFATIRGSPVPGIDSIAVPIFDERGAFAGAIICVGHADTLDVDPESPAVAAILARVRQLAAAPDPLSAAAR
ncbi:MAG: IclR family transcriptional regulator [Rhodobacteraceae bacterium]|nr:IclR family transcriptional regulator [Paracoccaceae bacterium]